MFNNNINKITRFFTFRRIRFLIFIFTVAIIVPLYTFYIQKPKISTDIYTVFLLLLPALPLYYLYPTDISAIDSSAKKKYGIFETIGIIAFSSNLIFWYLYVFNYEFFQYSYLLPIFQYSYLWPLIPITISFGATLWVTKSLLDKSTTPLVKSIQEDPFLNLCLLLTLFISITYSIGFSFAFNDKLLRADNKLGLYINPITIEKGSTESTNSDKQDILIHNTYKEASKPDGNSVNSNKITPDLNPTDLVAKLVPTYWNRYNDIKRLIKYIFNDDDGVEGNEELISRIFDIAPSSSGTRITSGFFRKFLSKIIVLFKKNNNFSTTSNKNHVSEAIAFALVNEKATHIRHLIDHCKNNINGISSAKKSQLISELIMLWKMRFETIEIFNFDDGDISIYKKSIENKLEGIVKDIASRNDINEHIIVSLLGHSNYRRANLKPENKYSSNYELSSIRINTVKIEIIKKLHDNLGYMPNLTWVNIPLSTASSSLQDTDKKNQKKSTASVEVWVTSKKSVSLEHLDNIFTSNKRIVADIEIINKDIYKIKNDLQEIGLDLDRISKETTIDDFAQDLNTSQKSQSAGNNRNAPNLLEYLYFSIYTITTTGYGDILPVSSYAKFLCSISNLLEIYFVVIFFNVFLSNLKVN